MAPGAASFMALLVPIVLLLLGGRRAEAASWGGAASGCLPVSVSIKAPARVAPAKHFRIKVTITNQGSGSIQNALMGVQLPVDLTVLKAPAGVVDAGNSPWTLALPALSLAPRKSHTITVTAIVGACFQGSFALEASVALPADPTCEPIMASRTVGVVGVVNDGWARLID